MPLWPLTSLCDPHPLLLRAAGSKSVLFDSFDLSKHTAASSIVYFLRAHPDPLTESQLAPFCITYADFMLALQHVQPSSKREGFATVRDVTWADRHCTRRARGCTWPSCS